MNIKTRKIDDTFLGKLKTSSLLAYVQNDGTLDMELRGDSVMIYYRGGKILEVFQNKDNAGLDKGYLVGKDPSIVLPSPNDFKNYLPIAKHIMDVHMMGKQSWEKDIQQRIVMENNYSANSMGTDFFIIDVEYQDSASDLNPALGLRFDLVALRWESDGVARKLPKNYLPKITIFEVKQGNDSSISNEDNGIFAHVKDFKEFKKDEEKIRLFKADMIAVFKQKRELGLLGKTEREKYAEKEITDVESDIDFVFLLANYKPASEQLKNELEKFPNIGDVKFMFSNPMGYGLYAENIRSADKLPWRFYA